MDGSLGLSTIPARPVADKWVDVTPHAALHGFSGPVSITHAAWMDAVYFVDDVGDRLDPVRENWRLGRLLEEVSRAVAALAPQCHRVIEFTLALREGSDRLRSLSLPGARLQVRVDREAGRAAVWVDVTPNPASIARRLEH